MSTAERSQPDDDAANRPVGRAVLTEVDASADTLLWQAVEALHGVVYFAPEANDAFEPLGIRGFWRGYFASRAAALGAVDAAPVIALFHGFAPVLVTKAIPQVWSIASIPDILAARRSLAANALRRAFGDVAAADIDEVGALTAVMVAAAPMAGRALAAAHAALVRPSDPLDALWHDVTALREWRGDGHIAVLTAAQLDGCEANVLMRVLNKVPERQRDLRGWTDVEWAAGRATLARRGWIDDDHPTSAGVAARDAIEAQTATLCLPATAALDTGQRARLQQLLVGLAQRVVASGAVPFPNPVGLGSPV